jgi:hypothetical protein
LYSPTVYDSVAEGVGSDVDVPVRVTVVDGVGISVTRTGTPTEEVIWPMETLSIPGTSVTFVATADSKCVALVNVEDISAKLTPAGGSIIMTTLIADAVGSLDHLANDGVAKFGE